MKKCFLRMQTLFLQLSNELLFCFDFPHAIFAMNLQATTSSVFSNIQEGTKSIIERTL